MWKKIKLVFSNVNEYKKNAILSPITMVFEVAIDVFIPFLMAYLIDNGLNKGDFDYVLKIGSLMLVLVVIGAFFGIESGRHAAIASTGLAKNLRSKLFGNLQSFSFENIDKFSTASLITRLTTDVSNMQNSFQMIIRMTVRSGMMFLFALIMAFIQNAKLALIFLVAIPILVVSLFLIIRKAHHFFRQMFKQYDKLNAVVQENLTGIRVVKAYVRESFEKDKFRETSQRIVDLSKSAEKIIILQQPIMFLTIFAVTVALAGSGGRLIIGGEMETGVLMSMFTYATQCLSSLMMIAMVLVMCIISIASLERVAEVLQEETTIKNAENPICEVADGSIVFENVSFGYEEGEEKRVLQNINLTIPSGATVGILGGTGSSKSTLVSLIPRLYDVQEGRVLVGGTDVRKLDLRVLRDNVSMVLQKNILFSGTVNDNMRWGKEDATQEEIIHACKLAQADEFVSTFEKGYHSVIERGGSNVSGGQRQRLCIARALLKQPKILILDDSTSAVDMKTDAQIRDAFANEIPNTTKLIIAQRIASVQDADMIIVLDEGKVSGVGTHDELYANNHIYREVYESQVKGGDDDAA